MFRASDAYQARAQGEFSFDNKALWSRMHAFTAMVGEATLAISRVPSSAGDYEKAYLDYQAELKRVLGTHIAATFELLAEEHLIQPTIIYDFPLAVSPLSKVKPDEPDWVERFEFYIGGFEVGNAFSELNDPDDQRRRFEAQLEDRKRGDEEAMAEVDEDYVRALGYGLPPTAGEGIGIDRLTMVLTGSKSIRDVILFPLLRPQTAKPDASE
jgi:lysyl-tRNA synthetase class 2